MRSSRGFSKTSNPPWIGWCRNFRVMRNTSSSTARRTRGCMRRLAAIVCGLSLGLSLNIALGADAEWPHVQSVVTKDAKMEARIAEIVSTLTLEQKVAQMTQPDIRYATPDDARKYRFGSILNGGGAFPSN